jgi:hypothetical protein
VWLPHDRERWQARWIDHGPEEKLVCSYQKSAERGLGDG